MKKVLLLFAGLLAVLFVQAQGFIKGTVRDIDTKKALPFVNVSVFMHGELAGGALTNFEGGFVVKPLPFDTCDIRIELEGYRSYERLGFVIEPSSRDKLEVELVPLSKNGGIDKGEPYDSVISKAKFYRHNSETKQLPLCEYKIVDKEIKILLDRVIEGKENTYGHELDEKLWVVKRGATCDLYLVEKPSIDTVYKECDYVVFLSKCDTTLPYPLKKAAPKFSLDSSTTIVEVTTTFYSKTFSKAEGYAKYRGRIFFICTPVDEDDGHFRKTGHTKIFNQKNMPECVIWDPPTWIYTKQQGHWYRWLEYPNGY